MNTSAAIKHYKTTLRVGNKHTEGENATNATRRGHCTATCQVAEEDNKQHTKAHIIVTEKYHQNTHTLLTDSNQELGGRDEGRKSAEKHLYSSN